MGEGSKEGDDLEKYTKEFLRVEEKKGQLDGGTGGHQSSRENREKTSRGVNVMGEEKDVRRIDAIAPGLERRGGGKK